MWLKRKCSDEKEAWKAERGAGRIVVCFFALPFGLLWDQLKLVYACDLHQRQTRRISKKSQNMRLLATKNGQLIKH